MVWRWCIAVPNRTGMAFLPRDIAYGLPFETATARTAQLLQKPGKNLALYR
jgi:hypothetical protein